MGDITFNCTDCGKSLVIDSRGAGMCVKCTDCGQELLVPMSSSDDGQMPTVEVPEKPKLQLKRPVQSLRSVARQCPKCGVALAPYEQKCSRCEAAKQRRYPGIKISVQSGGASIWAAFIIAFLVAVAGNVTWQWLGSYLGELPQGLDDIGGLFVLVAPIYIALMLICGRGFMIGLLCAVIYLGGIFSGDAIFLTYMDSSIHRNLNRNREALADFYAFYLVAQQAADEGLAIEDENQWEILTQRKVPEAREMLPTLSQDEYDELVSIWLTKFRELPLVQQIISLNSGINAFFILLGVCIAFWMGFRERKDA